MRYEENNLTKEEADNILRLIGQRIKAKRVASGIPQMELAKKLSFQKASLSRIESGKTNLKVYSVHKIAAVLRVNEHELLAEIDHDKKHSYESMVLLQAKFRRLGNRLLDLNASMSQLLAAIAASTDYRERIRLHAMAAEILAARGKMLEDQKKITEAMHRKEVH